MMYINGSISTGLHLMEYNVNRSFGDNADSAIRVFAIRIKACIKDDAARILREAGNDTDRQSELAYEAADGAEWMDYDSSTMMAGIALDIGIMYCSDARDSVRDYVWEQILEEIENLPATACVRCGFTPIRDMAHVCTDAS